MREVAQRSRCPSCSGGLIRVNGRGGPPVSTLNSALSNSASSCFSSFALAASSGARKASALPATSSAAGAGAAGRARSTPASSGGTSAAPRASTRSATAANTEYSAGVKNRSGCRGSRSRVLRSASGTAPAAASSAASPLGRTSYYPKTRTGSVCTRKTVLVRRHRLGLRLAHLHGSRASTRVRSGDRQLWRQGDPRRIRRDGLEGCAVDSKAGLEGGAPETGHAERGTGLDRSGGGSVQPSREVEGQSGWILEHQGERPAPCGLQVREWQRGASSDRGLPLGGFACCQRTGRQATRARSC